VTQPEPPTLFEVALYLICSSRNALDETLGYASMRMLDAAGRLMAAASEVQADPFLAELQGRIDGIKVQVMHDIDGYTAALEELQDAFVREAKARNLAKGQ
jgi:hypothetical protein